MKKKHILLPAMMIAVMSMNANAQSNWGNVGSIPGAAPTFTKDNVGIGTSAIPTDADLHIYGQATWVPGTDAFSGGACSTLGYPNPELWIDRQVDFMYASTCWPTDPPANLFQISNSGMSFSGWVSNTLDVFNSQGWLGVLQPKPAQALDVNGNALIEGGQVYLTMHTDHPRNIIANSEKSTLNLLSGHNNTDGASLTLSSMNAPANPGGMDFYITAKQGKGYNFWNYNGAGFDRYMNIAPGSGLVTVDNNLAVHGGQIDMTMTYSDSWRNINANSNTGGLRLSSGSGGYLELAGSGEGTQPGAVTLVSNGVSATPNNGFNFYTYDGGSAWTDVVHIYNNGKMAIGAALNYWNADGRDVSVLPDGYLLFVKEGILTEKVKVAVQGDPNWSDFVFNKDYKLMPLNNVESYINANKHLPEIPSASEVVKDGIDVATMDAKLLQKIEELTLYAIDQQKKEQKLQDLTEQLQKVVADQQKELAELKANLKKSN